jgi:N-acetylneuraminic acid mutarotase
MQQFPSLGAGLVYRFLPVFGWMMSSFAPARRSIHRISPQERTVCVVLLVGLLTGGDGMLSGAGPRVHASPAPQPTAESVQPISSVEAPAARDRHRAVWTGTEMLIWGGKHGPPTTEYFADGGRYHPLSDTWQPISSDGAPAPRSGETAIWTGTEMIIWGGQQPPSAPRIRLNDGARYDPETDRWTPISSTNAPSPRHDHVAVWTGTEMLVWGGEEQAKGWVSDGGRYEPVADTWRPIAQEGAPPPLSRYQSAWTGTELIVWGFDLAAPRRESQGARYDPQLDRWTPITTVDAPRLASQFSAVWTGTELLVWSKSILASEPEAGGRYDPQLDRWSPMSLVQSPSARYGHTTVWTGTDMLVWGGSGRFPNNHLNLEDGGYYNPASDTWQPFILADPREGHTAVWTGEALIVWGGFGPVEPGQGLRYVETGWLWSIIDPPAA